MNIATHQVTETACDSQSESSPAVLPADRRVGLRESLEQPIHLLTRHSDTGV
jgi:hypothetical protein